mmetsp:Transcript_6213/g.15746  ORF Transcript_6213/g.15746 Transcript_6213/m.15746 type:complete len:776 (-) Transcript_6213:204-2531(-)
MIIGASRNATDELDFDTMASRMEFASFVGEEVGKASAIQRKWKHDKEHGSTPWTEMKVKKALEAWGGDKALVRPLPRVMQSAPPAHMAPLGTSTKRRPAHKSMLNRFAQAVPQIGLINQQASKSESVGVKDKRAVSTLEPVQPRPRGFLDTLLHSDPKADNIADQQQQRAPSPRSPSGKDPAELLPGPPHMSSASAHSLHHMIATSTPPEVEGRHSLADLVAERRDSNVSIGGSDSFIDVSIGSLHSLHGGPQGAPSISTILHEHVPLFTSLEADMLYEAVLQSQVVPAGDCTPYNEHASEEGPYHYFHVNDAAMPANTHGAGQAVDGGQWGAHMESSDPQYLNIDEFNDLVEMINDPAGVASLCMQTKRLSGPVRTKKAEPQAITSLPAAIIEGDTVCLKLPKTSTGGSICGSPDCQEEFIKFHAKTGVHDGFECIPGLHDASLFCALSYLQPFITRMNQSFSMLFVSSSPSKLPGLLIKYPFPVGQQATAAPSTLPKLTQRAQRHSRMASPTGEYMNLDAVFEAPRAGPSPCPTSLSCESVVTMDKAKLVLGPQDRKQGGSWVPPQRKAGAPNQANLQALSGGGQGRRLPSSVSDMGAGGGGGGGGEEEEAAARLSWRYPGAPTPQKVARPVSSTADADGSGRVLPSLPCVCLPLPTLPGCVVLAAFQCEERRGLGAHRSDLHADSRNADEAVVGRAQQPPCPLRNTNDKQVQTALRRLSHVLENKISQKNKSGEISTSVLSKSGAMDELQSGKRKSRGYQNTRRQEKSSNAH